MNACRDADLVAGSMRFARSGSVLSLSECDTTLEGQQLSDTLQDNINHHTFNSPCAKLFLREIIERHNIRFDEELCFGEDALFVNTYLLYVNKLKVIPLLCYNYCDSGNDIYIKYSCSFTPIYHYYVKISLLYQDISNKFDIVINQRDLVGVVFNIALNCIVHNGIREKALVREFLTDCRSVKVLKSRRSIYLDVIIFLAQLPLGYGLILFVKCVEKIKSLNKS